MLGIGRARADLEPLPDAADRYRVIQRLRSQNGFMLIEMLAAIVIINVGLLVMLLALNSGVVTLRRSAQASTASAVADMQLERYRAFTYSSIYLDTTSLASVDSTYTSDSNYSTSQINQTCSPLVAACTPSQTVTGPDGRSYRIDTFIVSSTPAGGRPVKLVTVVVRKSGTTPTLARVVSTFDEEF
jgi:Tfp pilus assembly protein PilV